MARMSNASKISSASSLYDAIMLPTIQCEPIKVILPATEEEVTVDDNED